MRSFLISLQSEFFKSRRTLAFWASILIPVIICGLVAFGFFSSADKIAKQNYTSTILWIQYLRPIISTMGMLILPFYIIFMAFSVNNIEHKNDTWKMLFAQPLNKFSIYSAKYVYGLLLIAICLVLFALIGYALAYILMALDGRLNFGDASPVMFLSTLYVKLFISSLGIYSLQFILSLIWGDFLKPMGIGFILTIMGIITATVGWKYAYLVPYGSPAQIVNASFKDLVALEASLPLMQNFNWVSLGTAIVTFIAGYFILSKRNIK